MRALIKTAPGVGNLEILDTDMPAPGPGEALVRIGRSGLCGTDLLVCDGVYRGRNRPVPSPLIMGHEAAGEVVGLGPGTRWPPVGSRVGIEVVSGCGHCHQCLRGRYNLCQDWHHLGLTCAGLFAEFAVVPAASLLPLPDAVSTESAAFLEPLATAVHTLERVKPAPGTPTAIVGPGPLGFLHMLVMQAAGAAPIVMYGSEGDATRLRLAESLGAETFAGPRDAAAAHAARRTSGLGYGLVIEAAGAPGAVQTALDLVGGAGTLVSLGITRPTELDVLQVMRKNLTWMGVVSSVRRHFAEAVSLIQSKRVEPERLITHHMPLADALAGFDALRRRQAVKVMFTPA